jgi:tyrosinase
VPYWDWASYPTLSTVLSQLAMYTKTLTGVKSLANPLANYTFHPIPGGNNFPQDFPLSHAPRTLRTPDEHGNNHVGTINAAMQAHSEISTDETYCLVTMQGEYAPFSNTGFPAEKRIDHTTHSSLIHNQVRGLVWGNGHIADVSFSTLDPLFWLHHCNIDRIFAIWSAISPNSYVVHKQRDRHVC